MNLLKKDLLNFRISSKDSPNNFRYKYKIEVKCPKDFSKYQNPIYLFEQLRNSNINPKKVLNNLGKLKKGNPKLKTKSPISLIQNVQNVADLRKEILVFLEIILFCYLKLNTN